MRKAIELVAGPRSWRDTRESWLGDVPKAVRKILGTEKETVTARTVKAIWYGEITDAGHHAARDIRRAAEILNAKADALSLVTKYQAAIQGMRATDENLFRDEIARLERVARLLCGGAGS